MDGKQCIIKIWRVLFKFPQIQILTFFSYPEFLSGVCICPIKMMLPIYNPTILSISREFLLESDFIKFRSKKTPKCGEKIFQRLKYLLPLVWLDSLDRRSRIHINQHNLSKCVKYEKYEMNEFFVPFAKKYNNNITK